MTAEPEPEDEFQKLLEQIWEADQRKKAKALCLAGLLALGLVQRSLVRER